MAKHRSHLRFLAVTYFITKVSDSSYVPGTGMVPLLKKSAPGIAQSGAPVFVTSSYCQNVCGKKV
jgi:hypothetical protein